MSAHDETSNRLNFVQRIAGQNIENDCAKMGMSHGENCRCNMSLLPVATKCFLMYLDLKEKDGFRIFLNLRFNITREMYSKDECVVTIEQARAFAFSYKE